DLELAFGGGEVQRGAAVVVGGGRVDAGGDEGADLVEVALAGRPRQRHYVLDLGLVLLAARVAFAGASVATDQRVERVHVVLGDESAAELNAAHRIAVFVQPR